VPARGIRQRRGTVRLGTPLVADDLLDLELSGGLRSNLVAATLMCNIRQIDQNKCSEWNSARARDARGCFLQQLNGIDMRACLLREQALRVSAQTAEELPVSITESASGAVQIGAPASTARPRSLRAWRR
jgi:hypothetical protein